MIQLIKLLIAKIKSILTKKKIAIVADVKQVEQKTDAVIADVKKDI